jgi:glycosyltransferase involved in cell wall biosynthesis
VAKQDEISLHFVGASNPEYLETLRGQGIPFRHTPHVAHDALPSLIRDEADVVCLNSVEDGFGMVVTEALACGAPVAVSKFAGASEVVARNGGGIVYNPYDYPSTIVALRACASGSYPALQNRLPGWDSYADDLVGILDSVGSISPNLR